MPQLAYSISDWLGLDTPSTDLTFAHMALRGLVVFAWLLVLLHLSHQRLLGKSAGADILILVVLGSVLSRAVNGQAAFFPTLGVSALLVVLHRLLMKAAFHAHWISVLAKRTDSILVRDGQIDWPAMRRADITEDDLLEHLRLSGGTGSVAEVKEARLERSGTVSVIKRSGS
jgi:uncharacterized membrane protein YcaP (DUF421 family)